MNYHNIDNCNMINGEGLRVVLWVSGCEMRCIGCFNPETHPANSGVLFDEQAENELFEALKPDYIDGITFTGGHPLMECNRPMVFLLVNKFRDLYPNKTIWLYTGYTWEEIQSMPDAKVIVDQIDVLVDGKFVLYLKDNNLEWCGSSNQRVIDVKKSLDKGEVVLYN